MISAIFASILRKPVPTHNPKTRDKRLIIKVSNDSILTILGVRIPKTEYKPNSFFLRFNTKLVE